VARAKLIPMGTEENVSLVSTHGIAARRSLSALLSQVLVAFTVEFDNEFERRMGVARYPGAIVIGSVGEPYAIRWRRWNIRVRPGAKSAGTRQSDQI
jgi:hypothetical protein